MTRSNYPFLFFLSLALLMPFVGYSQEDLIRRLNDEVTRINQMKQYNDSLLAANKGKDSLLAVIKRDQARLGVLADSLTKLQAQIPTSDLVDLDARTAVPLKVRDQELLLTDSAGVLQVRTKNGRIIMEQPIRPVTDSAGQPIFADEIDTLDFIRRTIGRKAGMPSAGSNTVSEAAWDRALNIKPPTWVKHRYQLDSTIRVFGWHPYWMGTSYKSYNFSLLSHVAYFSYEMDPATGNPKTTHNWQNTALIDSAHQYQTKVLLTITNFGGANNRAFLRNSAAQKTLLKNIVKLLGDRNGDGVNIDFEGIQPEDRGAFVSFIITFSQELKSYNPRYQVTLAVPAIDFNQVYSDRQIHEYVDLFVIMGYEFYGQNSDYAGPVAPLTGGDIWWRYDLTWAVANYKIAQIPPAKILLGLPYYGAEWRTYDPTFPSRVKPNGFVRYPMYRNIREQFGLLECCVEEKSASKRYIYRDDTYQFRQIWFEDSISLGIKYDFVRSEQIGGVGIWALGYDNGYPELWDLLARKFHIPPAPKKVNAKTKSLSFVRRVLNLALLSLRNPSYLVRNPTPLFSLFGLVVGLSMTGFVVLYRYGCQIQRALGIAIKGSVIFLCLLAILLIYFVWNLDSASFNPPMREFLLVGLGFLLGGIIFFLISRQFLVEKDLP